MEKKKGRPDLVVAIVGLPNTGKTQTFNNLTGKYGLVANYPSTTVVENSAVVILDGRECLVVDTPGFHGLYADSEEELSVRNLILSMKPDVLLQCMDASRLRQSLYLTAQLFDLGIPMVVALNVIDETVRFGKNVDSSALALALGLPVVECVASEGKGAAALKKALPGAAVPRARVEYFPHYERFADKIASLLPAGTPLPFLATRLILQMDRFVLDAKGWVDPNAGARIRDTVREAWSTFDGNFNKAVNNSITKWMNGIEARVVSRTQAKPGRFADAAARVSRHPVWGVPILLVFIGLCYFAVVYVAGFVSAVLSTYVFNPIVAAIAVALPDGVFENLLVGKYGVLTIGLFNAIGTVLPVLTVFFLFFGFMEDVGYLPNLGILARRMLARMGLSGKSIMSIVLGFGCKTMATLTIKNIPSRKERIIATYLVAFAIPCSAQLGLIMAILGKSGYASLVIYFAFLLVLEVLAGVILNRILKDDRKSELIQELPSFRMPSMKSLFVKTGNRLVWFLKEATPVFVVAALAIFLVDLSGLLRVLKAVMEPVIVGWLGLPIEMVDALLLTLTRTEIGAGYILTLSDAGMLSFVQSLVAVVLATTFIPCSAHVAAMVKERGVRLVIVILAAIGVSSFVIAWVLKLILEIFV